MRCSEADGPQERGWHEYWEGIPVGRAFGKPAFQALGCSSIVVKVLALRISARFVQPILLGILLPNHVPPPDPNERDTEGKAATRAEERWPANAIPRET